MTLALIVAHVGHLLVDVPLFMGPVLLLVVALTVHTAHARRGHTTSGSEGEGRS